MSYILFLMGLSGIVSLFCMNLIVVLMAIELMLLAVNINFAVYSIYFDDIVGQLFALFILTVAGIESSIGLAIVVVYYRNKGLISTNFINSLKG